MIRKIFRAFLTCRYLEVHEGKHDKFTFCRITGALNPKQLSQCKHCKYFK